MFRLFDNEGKTYDRWTAIIENPNFGHHGHKEFYALHLSDDAEVRMHGSELTRDEAAASVREMVPTGVNVAPDAVRESILLELEAPDWDSL